MARTICPGCAYAYVPAAGSQKCPRCGYGSGAASVPSWSAAGARSFTPAVADPAPPAPAQAFTLAPPTNGFAVAALVLGIIAYPVFIWGMFLAPLAILFGALAKIQIKRKGQRGSGMALSGMILGAAWGVAAILIVSVLGPF